MIKINTDKLNKKQYGNRNIVDWENNNGNKIYFNYNNTEGFITLLDYSDGYVNIQYKSKTKRISTRNLQSGKFEKFINNTTRDFKFEIGDTVVDERRNLLIIDKEYRSRGNKYSVNAVDKWYKCICNNCGCDNCWVLESYLVGNVGCPCCSGHLVAEGINDITITAPWMVKYFQGGYDEAKLYTKTSDKYIYPICQNCGEIKHSPIRIQDIYRNHSIGCICSDGRSYPEKFVESVLNQLGINHIWQFSKGISKWCNNFKYDFKLLDFNCIVETHGLQHYEGGFESFGGKNVKEEQLNDIKKEKLAKINGIENYIVIDCRNSDMEWIKQSIVNSELPNLLNFKTNDIDWLKCHEYACNSLVKEVCEYRILYPDLTLKEIGEYFKINYSTVMNYIKCGSLIWDWINFDEERIKNKQRTIKINSKQVSILKNNEILGTYNSITELVNFYEITYNIKLNPDMIINVCKGRTNYYRDFSFQYA